MDSSTIVLLCVIVVYLLYAFFQNKRGQTTADQTKQAPAAGESPAENKGTPAPEQEYAAIAAVLAAVMGDSTYTIRRVYPVPVMDEKKSSWKITGRNESMMRRVFFKT